MAQSPAERQAAYRTRQKARRYEGLQTALERVRQNLIAEWIRQAGEDADEDEMAMLRAFAAEPGRIGDAFDTWLEGLLWSDLTDEIGRYRKDWQRARRGGRKRSA